ncbi:glutathione S-transferase [Ilyonectria robusta]
MLEFSEVKNESYLKINPNGRLPAIKDPNTGITLWESATDRYVNEIFRVIGVLEIALETNGTGWLVGAKMTYADLSFVTWASVGEGLLKELGKLERFDGKFPNYTVWLKKMEGREAVKKIKDRMARERAEHGLK